MELIMYWYYQFSLGNSFWIHPLVELSVGLSMRALFCCMVSGIFFWWRAARPVREAYLEILAAVMISPV
jgi:hypothetical protein